MKNTKNQNNSNVTAPKSHKSQKESSLQNGKKRASKLRKKLHEHWQRVERTSKYSKARSRVARTHITRRIEDETMDGVLIKLHDRNDDKSFGTKLRLLRRIVEKRQAQAVHHIGNSTKTNSRYIATTINANTSKCMAYLGKHHFAS